MSDIVQETIANSESNHKVDGIVETPPNCQCSPGCEKQVRRNNLKGNWNLYAWGHNPTKKSESNIASKTFGSRSKIATYGTKIESFQVKVFEKEAYNQKCKLKDEKTFTLLNSVLKGGNDEITVVYAAPETVKDMTKYFKYCVELLGMKIQVNSGHDHIALSL